MTQSIKRDGRGLTVIYRNRVYRPQHSKQSVTAFPDLNTMRDSPCFEGDDVDVKPLVGSPGAAVYKDNHREIWFDHGPVRGGGEFGTFWSFCPVDGPDAVPPPVRQRSRPVQPVAEAAYA